MWQINEVVRFDGVLHRILSVDNGSVVWIQIEQEKGVPQTLPELCNDPVKTCSGLYNGENRP